MTSRFSSIIPVWVVVAVGILLVGLLAPHSGYFGWLAIVLGASVLLTFIVQLALSQKEGLVLRMMTSIGGAVALVAIGTAVLAPLVA
ncbi:MAG: hypothetical protein JWR36_351 [Glaciihabitans sp.]|nr:hypothetical protein [Glaciihabitans sp.]MDQ1572279.1 hypothetical protein [Actinomycetota bacterium]